MDFAIQNRNIKEILTVENEPPGLTIGFNKRLVYSDSQNGVVEIGQNIINEKGIKKAINVGKKRSHPFQ